MRNNNKEIEVSVVIVCMNNIKNLFPCIESIQLQTKENSFEIIVVAYLFSNENLELLKIKFPDVNIIESKEIRGFSENNNIALRIANGKYCLILNDDTLMKMPVIDLLIDSFNKEPNASIISPKTVFQDGSLQSCGRPQINIFTYFLSVLKIWKEQKVKSKYTYQKGIFQSYNIVGAVFMIKTEVLKNLGYFNETYFFCPEDIDLSTLANKKGYKCFVNDDIILIHIEGGTASPIQTATYPAAIKGMILFLGNTYFKKIIISIIIFFELLFKWIYWIINFKSQSRKLNINKCKNAFEALFSNKTPKEIFIKFYTKIKTL